MLKKKLYILSALFFGVYVANILVGKISVIVRESNIPIDLDDGVAALILFISVILFVTGIFRYEKSLITEKGDIKL